MVGCRQQDRGGTMLLSRPTVPLCRARYADNGAIGLLKGKPGSQRRT